MKLNRLVVLGSTCLAIGLAGCEKQAETGQEQATSAAMLADWPHIDSAVAKDERIEARVKQMLAEMSLAQKIGQMTQAEIKTITPEQVREYYIGSVLNGGGSWPGMNKHAAVKDWLTLADRYHDASMNVEAKVKIPIIWGIDAVHGNSNVYGATLFPHNVGLGAAHDTELIEKIGVATAQSTRATGIGWVFAPTLAVAQNTRWGRSYESFSSDPALVKEYASAYVKGLQGDPGSSPGQARGDGTVVATAKHFIGDGATDQGKDQGNAIVDKATMINVHGQGYYGALAAGVQTVMASYNSWDDVAAKVDYGKMHGAKALLTEALKGKMGFDGFVVSDWNGIGQVPGCSNASCAKAINAGIDMVMVPDDWKAFIANTTKQVESGEIPMSRIDDAVARILRVKLRAGLFEHKPSASQYAGKDAALQHRELARRAVRESLVLLKNEGGALPLKRGQRVLVVGKGADSLPNQAGGWSLTWQGTDNGNADYPNADSIVAGFREALGEGNVTLRDNADGVDASKFDAVVAVIGETPYAEMMGDIVPSDTVAHSRRFPEDLATLQAAAKTGKPVITVFLSGRPLYANDLLNLSGAFVAAWLPGTEGKGIADVLVAGADGKPTHDFRGRLTFPWPNLACPAPNKPALFKPGYGLGYANAGSVAQLPLDKAQACGDSTTLAIFNLSDMAPFALQSSADGQERAVGGDLNKTTEWPDAKPALRIGTVQVNTQQDAKEVTWLRAARFFARNTVARNNLTAMAASGATLQFDVVVKSPAKTPVLLGMGCGKDCSGAIDLGPTLAGFKPGEKHAIKAPLSCFAAKGADLSAVDVPFSIEADAPFSAAFTKIRIVSGTAGEADVLKCPAQQ